MSSQRIQELHEQASERYLNGDYGGALQAWRDLLTLDPRNEQALDGVKLAAQFVEREEKPAASTELEHELDEGLSIFDTLGAAPAPAPARAPAPPAVQSAPPVMRLDPGATLILDRSAIQGLIDLKPAPAAEARGWEAPAEVEESSFELDPAPAPAAPSAAEVELKRRVDDLLSQAREKSETGERDEALAILGRLSILDEDNAEAAVLKASLESSGHSELDEIERAITEGVQAIENEHLDDAERLFNEVLAKSPEHREALHYLETIRKRRADASGLPQPAQPGMTEDLLGGGDLLMDFPPVGSPAPASHETELPVALAPAAKSKTPKPPRAAPPSETPLAAVAPTTRRIALPSARVLAIAGGGLCAVVLAVVLIPRLTGGPRAKALPPPAPVARTLPARPAPHADAAAAPKAAPLSVVPATAEDRDKAVATDVAEGKRQLASGDSAAAVISFNEALKLDPVNLDAKAGLHDAVEKYKSQKAERDALDGIKMAFRDQEYTSALRLAYRLPPTVGHETVARVKVAGWYNLGIVALRAGECREALGHFEEALAIDAGDAEAKKLHEFAKTYLDVPKDRKFLDFVEALQFRPPSL